jgi:hypothetical protein
MGRDLRLGFRDQGLLVEGGKDCRRVSGRGVTRAPYAFLVLPSLVFLDWFCMARGFLFSIPHLRVVIGVYPPLNILFGGLPGGFLWAFFGLGAFCWGMVEGRVSGLWEFGAWCVKYL